MSFSNPFTVSVPQSEVDFFFWPCMSGEKFPPTFTVTAGSMGYTSKTAFPAIGGPCGGATINTATWPAVAMYRATDDAFTGLTISGRFYMGPDSGGGFALARYNSGMFATSGAGQWQFQRTSPTNFAAILIDQTGTTVGSTSIAQGAWYAWTLTISAAGVVSGTINGVTLTSSAAAVAPIQTVASVFTVEPQAGFGITAYLSQLQVAYT